MLLGNNLVEFAAPIGLLCILIVGFGEVRRLLISQAQAQYIMGTIFGAIAVLEMEMPISPFEGVIIDLRNVPIVLAGAFLGWRGLAICLAMAMVTRLHIGGIGATAGIFGMLIAGYVGAIWAEVTKSPSNRGFWPLLALGALTPLSFLAVLFLPMEIAFWFFKHAAPITGAIYLTVVPLMGAFLQREILRTEAEHYMRSGASTCPGSGLLRPASFMRETVQLSVSGAKGTVGGLLVISPVCPKWVMTFWGAVATNRVNSAMATALAGKLTHCDRIGLSHGGLLLVPLTSTEVLELENSTEQLGQLLSKAELRLATKAKFRLRADLKVSAVSDATELCEILQMVDETSAAPRLTADPPEDMNKTVKGCLPAAKQQPLFAKLEATLASTRSVTVHLND
ncbi:LytS/YhcK type 5TM receptor domain-containing protein [Primorskyibacter sp. 2E233]|uniref:LytS/YhcK type 5TM receptor domain-containing protein n=1 Tax=Primorskyibacter sp. 2E233 TaxID=3413431 RepID=UPI003BF083BE